MLQKTKMVRKALESMYDGLCNVIEHRKVKEDDGSTNFKDVVVIENEPCKLSFKNINVTVPLENGASSVNQVAVLFISPDVMIKTGSKIVVSQNGVITEYKHSGQCAVYNSHQEIILELFERWA